MRLNRSLFLIILACTFFVSCSNSNSEETSSKEDFLSANLDTTVSPSQDFFLYANGGWIKRTTIPKAESAWGVGNLVQEDIYLRLRKINDDAIEKKGVPGSIEQKIGDFWFSGMDSVTINQQGLEP